MADERIREVITTHGLDVDYGYQLVNSPDEAEQYGFHGSPSILIDGQTHLRPKTPKSGTRAVSTQPLHSRQCVRTVGGTGP